MALLYLLHCRTMLSDSAPRPWSTAPPCGRSLVWGDHSWGVLISTGGQWIDPSPSPGTHSFSMMFFISKSVSDSVWNWTINLGIRTGKVQKLHKFWRLFWLLLVVLTLSQGLPVSHTPSVTKCTRSWEGAQPKIWPELDNMIIHILGHHSQNINWRELARRGC